MDNQQAKVSETNMGWLAGFIDGEGCFDLQRSYVKNLKRESWRPRLRISNTDVPTLSVVDDIFTKLDAGHHIMWRYPTNRKWLPSWSAEIAGMMKMQRLLIKIIPYLYTKRRRAELMLDFVNSRFEGSSKNPFSDYELELLAFLKPQPR